MRETTHDLASPTGPFVVRVLEVDPGLVEIVVAHAKDAAIGLETTRDLARRRGALAAVNGGFFTVAGPLAGKSEGILVVDGRVLSEPDRWRAGVGFSRITEGTRAIFGRPEYCDEKLDWRLGPTEPNPEDDHLTTHGALGAGPLLLFGGKRVLEPARESISRVFSEARHPRTAAAARADGSLLFVTVDGRQPGWSVGMTLVELSDFLLALGAVDAVNLDGGGSTAMVLRGETVNRPSDPTGDRANGDAILLFAR